jgi:ubiquinone/menaquinone biosynthesis C-methylase UbiE
MAAADQKGINELIKVFNNRKDLQNFFPEVWEGNLQKLVSWALEYGATIDAAKEILSPYINEYRDYKHSEKDTAYTWDNSAEHYIIDGFKIYWELLNRISSYQFECISGDKNVDLLSYTINVIKKNLPAGNIRAGFIGCDEMGRPEITMNKSGLFKEIIVMDIAGGLLEQQRQKALADNITNIQYLQSDFNKVIFQEDEFDYLNGWGTIHHIKNLEHFFSQAQKGLKKNGIMIIREYVGPDYLQFTDLQLSMVNSLLNTLPEELKYYQNKKDIKRVEHRINKKKLMQLDPTESIRSSDIIRVMNEYFDIVEFHKTGGTILHPLLNGIAGNFDRSTEGDIALQALIEIEKALITSGLLPSDYVYIVAKPRK